MKDDFYRQFEQLFRGDRTEIKSRLQAYLPFIEPLFDLYPKATALDLGCGRGEWLEILREKNFVAHGVDLDDSMLADCRSLNLSVKTQDAIAALQELDDESVSIVSAFHLVEHIPFDTLRQLVSESHRVLKPGGILIMETPNPENIMVGSSNFYMDPTHTRPIPIGLLSFIPRYYGFFRVKVLRLQESPSLMNNPYPTMQDVLEGVSPDYAVIAQKKADEDLLNRFSPAFSIDLGLTLHTLAKRYDESMSHAAARATAALAQEVVDMQRSFSWRLTSPFRATKRLLHRFFNKIKSYK